jgi:hypothetical protein
MNAPFRIPKPIEIDPRSCELCGRTTDQHECLDHGEGPEFFCWDDDDIVKCWEVADPRDAWRHTARSRRICVAYAVLTRISCECEVVSTNLASP